LEKVELEAKQREKTGRAHSRRARIAGMLPATVYGQGMDSLSIEVNTKQFAKIITSKAGHNIIITLKISGDGKVQNIPVLAHEILTDAIKDNLVHVDFYKINMEEEIKIKVPVILHGESTGVKLDGGILVQGLREVEVKCLPINIPDKFELDVTPLKIGGGLHVSDLKTEKGVTVVTAPTEILVTISAPAKEEEVVAPIAAPEVTGQAVPPTAPGAAPAAGAAPAGKEAAPAKGAAPAAKEAAPAKGAPAKGAPAKAAAPEAKKK
jgi:large subunit ribosomal protein L25